MRDLIKSVMVRGTNRDRYHCNLAVSKSLHMCLGALNYEPETLPQYPPTSVSELLFLCCIVSDLHGIVSVKVSPSLIVPKLPPSHTCIQDSNVATSWKTLLRRQKTRFKKCKQNKTKTKKNHHQQQKRNANNFTLNI